jgi:hypothetical protein
MPRFLTAREQADMLAPWLRVAAPPLATPPGAPADLPAPPAPVRPTLPGQPGEPVVVRLLPGLRLLVNMFHDRRVD